MKRLTASLAAVTLLGAFSVQAQESTEKNSTTYLPKTGDELTALIRDCSSQECFSYVSGVINGIAAYSYLIENPSPFCSGPQVRSNDIRDAIVGVVDDTPRLGRAPAPAAILTAFSRNWPCDTTGANAVANNIDGAEAQEDLITYTDLQQIDMDALLDFISSKSYVLSVGNPEAPLEKTLHVFHDPNCEYCTILIDELDVLVAEGWRAIVYPISNLSNASKGYAAVQLAVRDSDSRAPEALLRHSAENKDITMAMEVAQEAGMTMPQILELLAASSPYETLEANNQVYEAFGASQAPTWILGDRIASGIIDAEEIIRIQATMSGTVSPVPDVSPSTAASGAAETSTIHKAVVPEATAEFDDESSSDEQLNTSNGEKQADVPASNNPPKALRPGVEKKVQ